MGNNHTIDFQAEQITSLLDANASSKTSLLKSILGVIAMLTGTIIVNNKPLSTWTRKELAQFIDYISPAHNEIFPDSVEQALRVGENSPAQLVWCTLTTSYKNSFKLLSHISYQTAKVSKLYRGNTSTPIFGLTTTN